MWNFFTYGEKFTDTQEISRQLASEAGLEIVTDKDVVNWASTRFGIGNAVLEKILFEKSTFFENITHKKQHAIACLKTVLSEHLGKRGSAYIGFSGHLLPKDFPGIYRILITAETAYRVQNAFIGRHLPENQALKTIHREDKKAFRWCRRIYNSPAWDANSYDLVLPTDVLDKEAAVRMALSGFRQFMRESKPLDSKALENFQLAAKVEMTLAEKGYPVTVRADDSIIFLTINKPVLNLSKFSNRLTEKVKTVSDVKDVRVGVGSNFNRADLICNIEYEPPLEAQLSRYESHHAQLRRQAVSAIPEELKNAVRPRLLSAQHLRATD